MATWSIRRKLAVLVTIPLLVLLIGGGAVVATLAVSYRDARTTSTYTDALPALIRTGQAMSAELVPQPSAGGLITKDQLDATRPATDKAVADLKPVLKDLAGGEAGAGNQIPVQAQQLLNRLDGLAAIRSAYDRFAQQQAPLATTVGSTGVSELNDAYAETITAITGYLASNALDRSTVASANVVAAMNQAAAGATREMLTFGGALTTNTRMSTDTLRQLSSDVATQSAALDAAGKAAAGENDLTTKLNSLAGSTLDRWRQQWGALVDNGRASGSEESWLQFASGRIATMGEIENAAARDAQDSAAGNERTALFRVAVTAGAVLLSLLLVTGLLAAVARSVTVPLRRLRAGAVEVASVQLPAAVARIEQDGVAADVELPPVLPADAAAGPEVFEVARAVDDLGAEAVRLATAQVRLRRALDEAFVSMSRRSQSMVEKQLGIIDELESQEQDPDQLRNLFRLDHLAARMRRYNDNLLVLAGSAVRTRATAPVKVAELFRAATSEMEQYERVRLQPVSGASVAGTVAGELVHLLAELLDNAAMYSPPSSPIVLSAAFTADGGLQIEVLDAGVGISPGELDRLNARLTQPEAIDTQVPSRMGLFVVARLARRGGFGVMLQTRADAAGTVALVRVPPALVIGAPGSTGENPVVTSAAAAAVPAPAAPVRPASRPAPVAPPAAPSPTATAAAAAAAAAAGVRNVSDGEGPALPRRRRGAAGAAVPSEAAASESPASDLFAPKTPTGPIDLPDRSDPDVTAAQPLIRRPAPPETSPTGIPAFRAGAGTGSPGIAAPDGARSPSPVTPAAGFGLPPAAPAPAAPNPSLAESGPIGGNGAGEAAPSAWDDALPTELAARAAAAAAYRPHDPNAPMIGDDMVLPDVDDPTPIFDQISVWFTAEPAAPAAAPADAGTPERQPSSRWASLGDQRWLATNARAAAAPETEGATDQGLPKRRPGANLLPSASSAAPGIAPPRPAAPTGRPVPADHGEDGPADADLVRGRLGSYQRGLANARRARATPVAEPAFDPVGASLFTANSEASDDAAAAKEQGADQ